MFRDGIVKIDVRALDDSGSDTSSRFDYQLACSFLMMLSFLYDSANIVLMVEKIDDFVIVENEGQEDEVVYFFQVKTQKNRPFTVNAIIKNEWLKKQADNYVCFNEPNVKNIFLTNLGVSVNNKIIDDVSMSRISELEQSSDRDKLLKVIKESIKDDRSIDDFYLMKCTLSIDAFETQLMGEFHNFLLANKLGSLTIDGVEAAYKTIYHKLIKKRDYVLSVEEKKNPAIILEKKSINYDDINEILKITKDIEIPPKSDIAVFNSSYSLYLGSDDNVIAFLTKYENFREDGVKYGNTILSECRKCVKENQISLDLNSDVKTYSLNLLSVFDRNSIIAEDDFYKKYAIQIVALFVYKKFND